MRTFLIIWIGQLASILGSEMTNFALTIWAWDVTEKATPLSLMLFFNRVPKILAAPFVGVLVDRINRKQLMILGDLVAGLSSITILFLFTTNNLQVWHLYCNAAINGLFGYFQGLAYSASLSLIVPKQHYVRATALNTVQMSSSFIIAPALAGAIYSFTGLSGILSIDIFTFIIAISTLAVITIPQPEKSPDNQKSLGYDLQGLTFGFRYLFRYPPLLALLGFWVINNFIDGINFAILGAMILAQIGNNSTLFGQLMTSFGIGGLIGGLTLSVWGGPKSRIKGVFTSNAIWKFGLLLLSLAREMGLRIFAGGISGFVSPFMNSCNQAIWLSKVPSDVQGRVFSARLIMTQIPTVLAAAVAGIIADNFFEPAMRSGGVLAPIFGGIFGTEPGSGMALMVGFLSILGIFTVLGGYFLPLLRDIEVMLPDYK